jgi:hypothetical protein
VQVASVEDPMLLKLLKDNIEGSAHQKEEHPGPSGGFDFLCDAVLKGDRSHKIVVTFRQGFESKPN